MKFISLFFVLFCRTLVNSNLLGEVRTVEVLLDGKAALPCDVTNYNSNSNDSLLLVAWYKDNRPIYSFDGRLQKHWRDPKFSGSSRLLFTFLSEPAALLLSSATSEDAGIYRCRADFALTPTRNSAIKLIVVVLPSKPFFLDEIGNKVEGSVGPYHEDDTLLLQCLVIGGKPAPRVTWWKTNILLDNTFEPSEIPGVTENQLLLALTRDFAFSQIQCSAANNNVTAPLISTLDVELYVKPEVVSIMIGNSALSVGQEYEIPCLANGSHPKPEINWILDNKPIPNLKTETKHHNDEIISILHFVPRADHNELDLTCIATNRIMAPNHGSKQNTIRLNIFFPPSASIILVNEVYGNGSVKEGDAIHLRCMIEANPWITNTRWFANNISINGSTFNGSRISISSSDLIIFDSSISHSGFYSCEAFNLEGNGKSNSLQVKVMFKPRCTVKDSIIFLENTTIHCQITGFPIPNRYFWRINWRNSSEYNKNILISETSALEFRLINNLVGDDYLDEVSLTCWASNMVGEQKTPCNMHIIVPAMKMPHPPENCNIEKEENNLFVNCLQSNESESQLYVLSIWQKVNESRLLVSNITSPIASMRISDLQYGSSYEISLYSFNSWGKSDQIYLFEDIIQSSFMIGDFSLNIGLISGIVVSLIFTTFFVIVIIILRIRSKKKATNVSDDTKNVLALADRNGIVISSSPDIVEKPLLVNKDVKNCDINHLNNFNDDSSQSPPQVNRKYKPKVHKFHEIDDKCSNIKNDIECCFRTNRNKRENRKANGRGIRMNVNDITSNNAMTIHVFALSKESVV